MKDLEILDSELNFLRVAAAVPEVSIADPATNAGHIISMIGKATEEGVALISFPELCITGYTCADLFNQDLLLSKAEAEIERIAAATKGRGICVVIGAPLKKRNRLYNCGVMMADGCVLGVVPKSYLPNYNEFYERRWFTPGDEIHDSKISICGKDVPFGTDLLFEAGDALIGIEICEDLWVPVPPSCNAAMQGANVIVNLSATNEQLGKHNYLVSLIKQQSARCRCAYIYASAGAGESSTDLVFSGNALIAEDGSMLAESPRFHYGELLSTADIDLERLDADRLKFSTFGERPLGEYRRIPTGITPFPLPKEEKPRRVVDPHPFVPGDKSAIDDRCREISSIQAWGLARRLKACGCNKAVIGISGGLDSTLALIVAVEAFELAGLDRKGLYGITMPGFGTSGRTLNNARRMMELLGVSTLEIPIADAVVQHLKDIDHPISEHDVTYENSQARERTQILMDYSNKIGGIVVGTGDLSELALGWCTYNGDQMSMYGVNASVPKTLVKYLVEHYAEKTDSDELRSTLLDIVNTPISPELIPLDNKGEIVQKTEDLVGPYELHDFFIYHTLRYGTSPAKIFALARIAFEGRYDEDTLRHWLINFYRRFFSQQFKRSCMPDGPKVGSVCLSPRGDWRMPSDASGRMWRQDAENAKI